MQLRATDAERRDIGGALADALGYFDDAAPFIRLLNFLGPWAGVIDGVGDSISQRIVYIAQHRRRAQGSPPAPFAPTIRTAPPGNGRASYDEDEDVINAPDPGKVAGY